MVEVECRLADTMQSLLIELTALRAKLAEMQGDNTRQEKELRAQIRHEYQELVQNLFSMVFDLNHRLDEVR